MGHEVVEHVHGQGRLPRLYSTVCPSAGSMTPAVAARAWATVGGLDEHQVAVVVALGDADGQTGLGAAVLFAHDDVLGDVDQTTGQ